MAPCPINPTLPIFSQALPTFATHIFSRRSFHTNMLILCIYTRQKSHCSVCQKCSVTQKYAKNAFSAWALPRAPLGELMTLPKPSIRLGKRPSSPYPALLYPAPSALASCAPAQTLVSPRCFMAGYTTLVRPSTTIGQRSKADRHIFYVRCDVTDQT